MYFSTLSCDKEKGLTHIGPCVISSPVSMPNNDLYISGTGTFSSSADIDVKNYYQDGMCVTHFDGGYIK